MIAGQHSQAAGINGHRFVQAELGGKIRDGLRPQHAGMTSAPSAVGLEVFLQAAVGVVDAAVQHHLGGAAFQLGQRNLRQQGNGIVVQLRQRTGSRSRNRLTESWSQLHHRLRASAHKRSCSGAMKRSRVRASLTMGAT